MNVKRRTGQNANCVMFARWVNTSDLVHFNPFFVFESLNRKSCNHLQSPKKKEWFWFLKLFQFARQTHVHVDLETSHYTRPLHFAKGEKEHHHTLFSTKSSALFFDFHTVFDLSPSGLLFYFITFSIIKHPVSIFYFFSCFILSSPHSA